MQAEDESEDLLEAINSDLDEGEMTLPIDNTIDYIVEFNGNVKVHVQTADEYLGRGENETYTCIKGLIVTEWTTKEDIASVVEWIKKFA